MYAEWFLTLYKEIQEKSVFNHKLYRGGEPLKLLLEVQEMIQHLLDRDFLDTYRITNFSIKRYENVERIENVTKEDIVLACSIYKPLPTEEKLSLNDYFLNKNTRYSRLVEDITNPGYVEAMAKIWFPEEYEIRDYIQKYRKEYQYTLETLKYENTIQTRRKFVSLHAWWIPHSDKIWRFADSGGIYQKSFKCLIDYWAMYTKDIPEIGFNGFGMINGKMWSNFLDFCVRDGYNLRYNTKSWLLPENRRKE